MLRDYVAGKPIEALTPDDKLMIEQGIPDAREFKTGNRYLQNIATLNLPSQVLVHFATNSAELTLDDKKEIEGAVTWNLLALPNMKMKITGHTDNVGSSADNMALSNRRAESVRSLVLSQTSKIAPNRMTTAGSGDTVPAVPNNLAGTPGGTPANRRIELTQQH